uniref:Profilin n=1 Tax=Haliotis diversicolor TaxID=36095 RepID=B3TK21_HALDV|nr:profilin [Haliotis diversicolor]
MSWDEQMKYLKNCTGDKMYFGAICGKDGNVWASSCKDSMNVSKEEAATMSKICEQSSAELGNAQCGGVYLGANKFRFVRSDGDEKSVTFTRNLEDDKSKLHNGFAIETKQAVVICVCEEEGKGTAAATGACKMAEYLTSVGY